MPKLQKMKLQRIIPYAILTILVILPLFLFLDKAYIEAWDESRNASNAQDMYWFGFSFITYFDNLPDLWNTKPPLLIWLQVLFMEIFGVNELSVRLPSAFAALGTCILLFIFLKRYLSNVWIASISVLILVTTTGYVHIHGTRTGDFDALLTMFTTLSALMFFAYSETKNKKYLLWFFIALAFSVLTKSIAGLMFLPALAIYAFFRTNIWKDFLVQKYFYLGILCFVVLVGGYYGIREMVNPGYLEAVYFNELGGRALNALEGNEHERFFYFNNLIGDEGISKNRYVYWLFFLPFSIALGLLNKSTKIKRITFFSILLVVVHFTIITLAETKLFWYDIPAFPFLAILNSIGVFCFLQIVVNQQLRLNGAEKFDGFGTKNAIALLLLALIFLFPYYTIMKKITTFDRDEWHRNQDLLCVYMKDIHDGVRPLESTNLKVFHPLIGRNTHTRFYINNLNYKGANIDFVTKLDSLKFGDIVIVGHGDDAKQELEATFDVIVLENHQKEWSHWGLKKYKILNRK